MLLKYKKIRIYFYSLFYDISYFIQRKITILSYQDKVLCRTCCLGNECIKYLKIKNIVHLQKLRIDGFLKENKSPFLCEVINLIKNQGIVKFISELQINPFLIKKYKFMLFDSFSELVDAKFIMRNKKIFYAVKGDVKIDKFIKKGGQYCKQISLENLKEIYEEVFDKLWLKYNCKIFFILCPTKFDNRNYYKDRSIKIAKIIKEIAKEKNYLICIEPQPLKVIKSKEDDFPYHFDSKTIMHISNLLIKQKIVG